MMRAVILAVALLAPPVYAAELRSVTLDKRDGIYYSTSEVWLDAPRADVFAVLSNWDISTQFSSLIIDSRNLAPDSAGRPGFYMRNNGCVLFFCQTVERAGFVELESNHLILAVADADESDFEMSEERWVLNDENNGTQILYELKMKPKFWIPPIIGPYAIKRKIRNDGLEALERIEVYVQEKIRGNE